MTPPSIIQAWPNGPTLDARRCVHLAASATLVVADLHLGYAWSRRKRGVLLPVETPDDTLERLTTLHAAYQPRRWVLLGDVVHEALDLPPLERVLRELCDRLARNAELIFCLGNHDRNLGTRIREWSLPVACVTSWDTDGLLLAHGDTLPAADPAQTFQLASELGPRRWLIGHEHPALSLGDGVATRVKCPAFLVAHDGIVLPAFSSWAAGCDWGRQPFLGPVARAARFQTAWVCAGKRLLPVPLGDSEHQPPHAPRRPNQTHSPVRQPLPTRNHP